MREAQLRCFDLEMRKANNRFGITEIEQQKLSRYNALLYPDRRNLSADAWMFWNNVKKNAGRKRRKQFITNQQTQIAEMFP